MKLLIALAFVACNFLFPVAAWAEANLKSPLSYTLREYGVILGVALLGGFASWFRRVKRGEVEALNFAAMVGELMISAFAGLLAFWVCEYFALSPLLTAAAAGIAGHAGGTGISWMERLTKRYVERKFGFSNSGAAPLGDK